MRSCSARRCVDRKLLKNFSDWLETPALFWKLLKLVSDWLSTLQTTS